MVFFAAIGGGLLHAADSPLVTREDVERRRSDKEREGMVTIATKEWTFVTKGGDKVAAKVAVPKMAAKYPNAYVSRFLVTFRFEWSNRVGMAVVSADTESKEVRRTDAFLEAKVSWWKKMVLKDDDDSREQAFPEEPGARTSTSLASGDANLVSLIGTNADIAAKEAAEDAFKLVKARAPKKSAQ